MAETDYQRALEVAVEAAREAASILLAECARAGGPRGSGGHCPADDEAEHSIRERLTAAFPDWGYLGEETGSRRLPAGEAHLWLVDPNDGTDAMLKGFRGHAVSIGLLRAGVPVLGVVHAVNAPDDDGDRFAWSEGCGPLTRNGQVVEREAWPAQLGPHDIVLVSQAADQHPAGNLDCVQPARFLPVASIAYRLALVAVGEGVAAVSLNNPGAWDYGGGHALLRAVGGVLVDQDGADVTYSKHGRSSTLWCFAGGPGVVQQLLHPRWRAVFRSGFGQTRPPANMEPARLAPGAQVREAGVLRRAQGCLLGQVAGDSLGSLVEFQSSAAIAQAYRDGGPRWLADGGTWGTVAGQPTDDSELALVLARTLVQRGRYDQEAVAVGYGGWYNAWTHELAACEHAWCRPFDVGSTTASALGAISLEDARSGNAARAAMQAANHSSQANGALMRISPLGIWGVGREPAEVAEAARADARLTHPHPVCQEASALFATTVAHAIGEGSDPARTYAWAGEWAASNCSESSVCAALERAGLEAPPDFHSQQGWVLIALQNAFYRLIHEPSLDAAVISTVRAGGDTDTNAAICGALVGAVHGRAALPPQWCRMVLTCRPMLGYQHVRQPRPAIFWPADALTLAERLLQAAG